MQFVHHDDALKSPWTYFLDWLEQTFLNTHSGSVETHSFRAFRNPVLTYLHVGHFVLPFLWRTKVLPVARILIWPEPDLGSSMPGFFYRPVRFSADHLTNSACFWVFNKLVKAAMSIFWLRPTSHVALTRLRSKSEGIKTPTQVWSREAPAIISTRERKF